MQNVSKALAENTQNIHFLFVLDDRIGAMNLYRMGINYPEDSQVPDTVAPQHI